MNNFSYSEKRFPWVALFAMSVCISFTIKMDQNKTEYDSKSVTSYNMNEIHDKESLENMYIKSTSLYVNNGVFAHLEL